MSEQLHKFPVGWWAENLDLLDREIARMATLCEVRILDPQVMKRVLMLAAAMTLPWVMAGCGEKS